MTFVSRDIGNININMYINFMCIGIQAPMHRDT